jgi:type I restriction enzyme R subunit
MQSIASELVTAVRENAGMDWWHFDQRRKRVRTTIKRILRKYGYPPDLEDSAVRTVVLQAEALAMEIKQPYLQKL